MYSRELKDLIIVNLTGAIALSTSVKTIFIQSTENIDELTGSIARFYWIFVAGLLLCYVYVCLNERKQNEASSKIENAYCKILIFNLICTTILVTTLGLYNQLQKFSFFLIPTVSLIVLIVGLLTIAYYPFASFYFFIKDKGSPVMFLGALAFFVMAFWLLIYL